MGSPAKPRTIRSWLGGRGIWVLLGVGLAAVLLALALVVYAGMRWIFWVDSSSWNDLFSRLHDHPGMSLGVSPCGQYAMTHQVGGIRLWDLGTGERVEWIREATGTPRMANSPGGGLLLAAASGGSVLLWEIPSAREPHTFPTNTPSILGFHFSPDGTRLLVGSDAQGARIWDTASGEMLHQLGHGRAGARGFSPDGARVLTYSEAFAHLWDAETGEFIREFGPPLLSGTFSADGSLVFGGETGGASLWGTETGERLHHFGDFDDTVVFSPCGTRVLVQDHRYGRRLTEAEGNESVSGQSTVPMVGDPVIYASENVITLYNAETGEGIRIFGGSTGQFGSRFPVGGRELFCPIGSTFINRHWDRGIELRSMETGEVVRTIRVLDRSSLERIVYTPDGSGLLTLARNGVAALYSTDTGAPVHRFNPPGERPDGRTSHYGFAEAALSPDGSFLLTGGLSTEVWLWDTRTGELLHTFDLLLSWSDTLRVVRRRMGHRPALLTLPVRASTMIRVAGTDVTLPQGSRRR